MRIEKMYCDLCGGDMTGKMCARVHLPMTDKNTGKIRIKDIEICYECGCKIARKIEEAVLYGKDGKEA